MVGRTIWSKGGRKRGHDRRRAGITSSSMRRNQRRMLHTQTKCDRKATAGTDTGSEVATFSRRDGHQEPQTRTSAAIVEGKADGGSAVATHPQEHWARLSAANGRRARTIGGQGPIADGTGTRAEACGQGPCGLSARNDGGQGPTRTNTKTRIRETRIEKHARARAAQTRG